MDYKNVIWIKTEITDELSTVPEPTVQVCPPTTNVKEELQESVNQEFLDDSLIISESTDCINEDPEPSLEPEDSENILCVPEVHPQVIKEEVLEIENDCHDECDPLSITNDKEVTSERCAPDSTRLSKISTEIGSIVSEEAYLQKATGDQPDFAREKSEIYVHNGPPVQVVSSKHDTSLCTGTNSIKEDEFSKLTCNSCKQTFLSKYSLIMHVFIHIDGVQPPAHICKNCGEVFPTCDSLSEHSVVQKGISPQECLQHSTIINECGCLQPSEVVREEPLKCSISSTGADNVRPERSDVRGESSNQSHHLNSPWVINTEDRPYSCDVCGKSFALSGNLKKHTLIHTGERTYKCKVCGVSFMRAGHLKEHILIHTGVRQHKCQVCGKSFTLSNHLKRHLFVHTGMKPYKCDICGKTFTECGSLKKHSLIHSGDRPHKCDVCGNSYAVSDSLKRHMLSHTGERPHKCDVCGKSFTRAGSLKAHFIIHTSEGPHKCDVCGKSFTYSWNLKAHTLIHIGEKRHKCDFCGKSFTQAGSLKAHKLIHSGERPHECDICGKSFTESGTLKKHLLIHTGKRPHKCDICGKSFTEAGSLRKHNLTHTGEKPYQCHVCGKSFTQSGSLRAHTMIHIGQTTNI